MLYYIKERLRNKQTLACSKPEPISQQNGPGFRTCFNMAVITMQTFRKQCENLLSQ
jgi:hypothetical protein